MLLSGWESVFFWIFSMSALFAGILTILARNAVHSALFLISSLVSIAALFILLGAEFIAGVQILVYVGGVMVLFLFVIMLVNVSAEERGRDEIFNSTPQVAASLVLALLLLIGFFYAINHGYDGLAKRDAMLIEKSEQGGTPIRNYMSETATMRISHDSQRIGGSLYRYASLPFEIASLLLLVAIVGAVMLARTVKQESAVGDVDPDLVPPESSERVVELAEL